MRLVSYDSGQGPRAGVQPVPGGAIFDAAQALHLAKADGGGEDVEQRRAAGEQPADAARRRGVVHGRQAQRCSGVEDRAADNGLDPGAGLLAGVVTHKAHGQRFLSANWA